MTGKRCSQLQSFKGNSSLASAQRSGDFEFKVMEVHVAGCIHAISRLSCQLAGLLNLVSERASITCQRKAFSIGLVDKVLC